MQLHAVGLALDPRSGHFGGQVQHDGQIGHQAVRGNAADRPKGLHVQSAAIPLVHDVGQQVAIGDNDFARLQVRPDPFGDQFAPGRHVEEHFTAPVDG